MSTKADCVEQLWLKTMSFSENVITDINRAVILFKDGTRSKDKSEPEAELRPEKQPMKSGINLTNVGTRRMNDATDSDAKDTRCKA